MTFSEIVSRIADRLNIPSTATSSISRIGRTVNDVYREVTTSIGLDLSRRVPGVTASTSPGIRTVTFNGIEKIERLIDDTSGSIRVLTEISYEQLSNINPAASDNVRRYAIESWNSTSVTVRLDVLPQTAFTLKADGYTVVSELDENDSPAFPESFHDILIDGVLAEEYTKQEKAPLADRAQVRYEKRVSDLRMWRAKSISLVVRQGEDIQSLFGTGSSGSSGGSAPSGGTSYEQTGLVTFNRDPSTPFAVTDDSAYVPNLFSEGIGNVASDRLLGRDTAGVGESEQLTVGGGLEFTGTGGIRVASSGITYSKIQDISANSRLLGRGTVGTGPPEEISLGTGLSISGSTLSVISPGANKQVLFNNGGILSGDADFQFEPADNSVLLNGDFVLGSSGIIRRSTTDGSDTGLTSVTGGGSASTARGGAIHLYGNENAGSAGKIQLVPGNVANSAVEFFTSAGVLATSFDSVLGQFSNLGTRLASQGSVSFNNSTSENTLFTYTVPANAMNTNRVLRFNGTLLISTDTGGTRNVNLRFNFGSLQAGNNNISFPVNTTYALAINLILIERASTASQNMTVVIIGSNTGGGTTLTAIDTTRTLVGRAGGTVNTALPVVFSVTAQMDTAVSTFSTNLAAASLELI